MSFGPFVITGYASTLTGDVHPLRVQPETLLASFAGTINVGNPAGINSPISAIARKGRRELGLGARRVSFKITAAGDSPYAVGSTHTIPVPDATVFAGINKGQAVSYNGATGVVTGTTPESVS